MKGSEVLALVTDFLSREQRATTSALHCALGIPESLLSPALEYLSETGRAAKIKAQVKFSEEQDDYGLPMGGPSPSCGGSCRCSGGNLGVHATEIWVWKG